MCLRRCKAPSSWFVLVMDFLKLFQSFIIYFVFLRSIRLVVSCLILDRNILLKLYFEFTFHVSRYFHDSLLWFVRFLKQVFGRVVFGSPSSSSDRPLTMDVKNLPGILIWRETWKITQWFRSSSFKISMAILRIHSKLFSQRITAIFAWFFRISRVNINLILWTEFEFTLDKGIAFEKRMSS